MPLTTFPRSNHQGAVNTHATTVLRGLQARSKGNPVTGKQIVVAYRLSKIRKPVKGKR